MDPAQIRQARENYARLFAYYADPDHGFYRFLSECVYTKDEEADPTKGEETVKKFPANKSYVLYTIKHVNPQRLIVQPKSRRMVATWYWSAYAVWTALFKDRRNVLWQSQNGQKSADTLENKMLFILEHIPYSRMAPFVNLNEPKTIPKGWPEELVNWYKPKRGTNGLQEITFIRRETRDGGEEYLEENSSIYGVAEGKDQWRQYTVSLGILDEYAFFTKPEESAKGARPTVGTTGQLVFLSSANPGYMAEMAAEPELHPGQNSPPQPTPDHPGIRTWFSEMGYFVYRLHYTADEERRGHDWTQWADPLDPDYRKPGSKGYARLGYDRRQWDQEQEIDFTVHTGQPFYPEFNATTHIHALNPIKGWPIWLSFDFGLQPATVIFQIDPRGFVLVLGEYVSEEAGIRQHARELTHYLNLRFPWWKPGADALPPGARRLGGVPEWLRERNTPASSGITEMVVSWVDPAGLQRSQTDMTTPVDILREMGFNPRESVQDPIARAEAVRELLTRLQHYEVRDTVMPSLIIDPQCKHLIEALKGGAKVSKTSKLHKEKNFWSHVTDAFEYGCVKLVDVERLASRINRKIYGGRRRHVQKSAR